MTKLKESLRRDEIRKVRNQIRELLAVHKCHIELGRDVIAGPMYFLCPDEEHDRMLDDGIQVAKDQ